MVAAAWLTRDVSIEWPRLAVVALAAALVPLVQLAAGEIRFVSDAVLAAAYVAGFGLTLAAGATLVRRRSVDLVGALMTAFAVAAIASAAMALMQWQNLGTGTFVDAAPPGARFYANFGQPNNMATALAIGVCGILLGYARGKIGPAGAGLAIALLGFGMVMTESRTGWLFVALLTVALLTLRKRAKLNVPAYAVIVGAGLFLVVNAGWSRLNELLLMAHQNSAAERLTSGSLRLIHWQVIWDAIWQRPWFGFGWTQTMLAQQAAVLRYPATGEVLYSSHNIMLDLLVWNGVPIGALIIVALVWWFVRQFRLPLDSERVYVLLALVAIAVHGLLELPLEYSFFLLPAGLLMGALDGASPPAPSWSTPRIVMAVPALALSALIGWVGSEYIRVDQTARTLRFVAMGIGLDRVSAAPEPDVILLDRLLNLHRYMLTPARKSDDPAYMQWVRDVATRQPLAPAMLRYALAAGLNGQVEEAKEVLARICKMHSANLCADGRASWSTLQQQHPELRNISFPPLTAKP